MISGDTMKRYESINPALQAWIAEQKIFFVATAPLSRDGHINCSPKGADTFRVLGERAVAYLDLTGSGAETIAHLRENGRIVIMFCAFDGAPKIVRLHGVGKVVYPDEEAFVGLSGSFSMHPGARAIVSVAVDRVSDSCGFAVPFFEFVGPRDGLDRWTEKQGPEKLAAYRESKNRVSIDGLPGYERG